MDIPPTRQQLSARERRPENIQACLRRDYPGLARVLGEKRTAQLTEDFLLSRPFFRGFEGELEQTLPDFLAVALSCDSIHAPWLAELAQLEHLLGELPESETRTLVCEYRVDQLLSELGTGPAWHAPRLERIVLTVEGGKLRRTGAPSSQLEDVPPALPTASRTRCPSKSERPAASE